MAMRVTAEMLLSVSLAILPSCRFVLLSILIPSDSMVAATSGKKKLILYRLTSPLHQRMLKRKNKRTHSSSYTIAVAA